MDTKISTVLFDMDGTITDTEKVYNKFWIEAAHSLGEKDFGYEDALLLRSLNSTDARALMQSRFSPEFPYDEIHMACRGMVTDYLAQNDIPLKPGVFEILSYLKENGYKTAVVTATKLDLATERLKKANLFDKFDTVVSAHQAKRGKPHADPYLFACDTLRVTPSECLAVEDAPNGVKSAYAAGCRVVMIPDLTEPTQDLLPMLYASVPSLLSLKDILH